MTDAYIQRYKYHILFGTYVSITGLAFLRIARQPYPRSFKGDQMESVFKATTLAALIASIGISGNLNRPRSAASRE